MNDEERLSRLARGLNIGFAIVFLVGCVCLALMAAFAVFEAVGWALGLLGHGACR